MAYLNDEAQEHVEAFSQILVKHARLQEVDKALALRIEAHADAAHLLLYGATGVGKSTVLERTTQRFREEEPNPNVIPVIFLEARPSDNGPYVRMDYYRQVLTALKGHILVREMLVDITRILSAPKPTRLKQDSVDWLEVREATEKALKAAQVKAVLIDEAQHLMQGDERNPPDAQLNWLKSMSNQTKVLHILSGPFELFPFHTLNGQASRRGRGIYFERYHVDNKQERAEFVGALEFLLQRLPVNCDIPAMLKRWRWFAEGSIGCVGILKTWLVEALTETFAEGSDTLLLETMDRTRLHSSQLAQLQTEAQAGEQMVQQHRTDSERQLQLLLGKGGQKPTQSPDKIPPHPSPSRLGERQLGSDPVGETDLMQPRQATHCTFNEIIALLSAQMRETTVTRVECPVCRAVRDIQPKAESIKFPRHPERVTTKPNQGWRWVRQEDLWELAE